MTLKTTAAVTAIAVIALASTAPATPFTERALNSAFARAKLAKAERNRTAKTEKKQNHRMTGLRRMIAKHARANGIPVKLAHAVVSVESRYNPRARGKAGEVGLMQIKPSTARGIGYKGSTQALYDPETNLRWGMKYLGEAHRLGGGSICGTILKYNAGHYAKRMNKTSAKYCSKVKRLMASS